MEFRIVDDGRILRLAAPYEGGKVKRWKCGTLNPASKVSIPNPQNERDRILSEDEWKRLYSQAADHLKPIMLVAYRLGMRFSEILNLTWDRVGRERGLIALRAVDTKTKQPRQVPMTADVLAAFKELHRVRYLGQDRVFLREGQRISSVRTAFENAKERAEITDFRFHDFRHCAATGLRRAGVDNTTAMAIIGHRSPQMWRRYNTIDAADLKAAAAKVNTLITLDLESSGASVANCAKR